MHKNVVNLLTIFTILVPFALLTGPFIPDLLISLSSMVFIIYSFKTNLSKYFKSFFFKISLLFWVYILIRSILSDYIFLSLESSLFYIRFSIFVLVVWFLLQNNTKFLKYFVLMSVFALISAVIDGYHQYIFGTNIFGIMVPGVRMSLLLNDNLLMGSYLARLFPLVFGITLFLFYKKSYFVVIAAFAFILIDVLIFLSGERTSFILLLISTLFIIIFISQYKFVRLITLVFSLIFISIIAAYDSDVRKRNLDLTVNQMGINKSLDKIVIFSPLHQSHYIGAFNMFKDSPVFGHGPKTFRVLCSDLRFNYDKNTCSSHPHNTYLQLLAETGIVGLSFIVTLIVILFRDFIRIFNNRFNESEQYLRDFQLCLFACFIITLWPIAPNQSFFNNWISIVYYLPVGFYLYHREIIFKKCQQV